MSGVQTQKYNTSLIAGGCFVGGEFKGFIEAYKKPEVTNSVQELLKANKELIQVIHKL